MPPGYDNDGRANCRSRCAGSTPTIAQRQGKNALAVDIGGVTTDVSVSSTAFNRTVSANLGMSYSISNVVAEAGLDNVLRWVHLEGMDERELRNRVKNKTTGPPRFRKVVKHSCLNKP